MKNDNTPGTTYLIDHIITTLICVDVFGHAIDVYLIFSRNFMIFCLQVY